MRALGVSVSLGADGAAISGSTVPAASASDELLRYPTNLLQSPLSVTEASLSSARVAIEG